MFTKKVLLATSAFLLSLSAAPQAFAEKPADQKVLKALKADYQRPKDIPHPENNKHSKTKEALGKILFFDPRLSKSGTQSCATCHNPVFSWGDGMGLAVGHGHKTLGRKTPTVHNLAWDDLMFWDGRSPSLEDQALGPIQAAGEMNMDMGVLLEKLVKIKGYGPLFKAAFPNEKNPVTKENIGKAVATFERQIVSGNAPFDNWLQGDEKAISESAKRGFIVFNKKGNCAACHDSWRFSDGSFHDIGLKSKDIGRGKLLPNIESMKHAFKTVSIRNIAHRPPYMHDGSLATLMDVVDHYNDGFIKRPSLSDDIGPLNLTQGEKEDLVNFLKTLTSHDKPTVLPVMPM